ncbi:MAG: class I SAM-dependent methyltransferase [Proteobacteria bacterium]|uniref:Class I SAM-dependent methyltransferase n=1 Tax=Candidatus Avisuccinivibrio stercorigallinarum TaxID=2840704 RepID=A0A9D9GU46_9GAMM|nr:class I SAM-dependent methyltransferase [Candidatus Avisuccinivibrio stercorigallinarum]
MSALPLRYETAYSTVLYLSKEQRQECIEQVLRLAALLGLKTCALNADVIVEDKTCRPYIIDCAPRFGGNNLQALIKTAFGLSVSQAWLKLIFDKVQSNAAATAADGTATVPDHAYFMQLFSFDNTELRALTALPDLSHAPGLIAYNSSLELNSLVCRSSSGKFSDFGYFITRADNAQSARQYAKDLLGKFHSVPVYQMSEVCPFCGSSQLHVMPERSEQLMPGVTSKFFAKALKFTPAFCEDCGCGFSMPAIDPQYSTFIYSSNYKFPRGSKLQDLPNYRYITAAVGRFCAADDFIVEIGSSDGTLLHLLQQQGFTKLLGFDPGAPESTGGTAIKKEFFTADTHLPEQPQAFIFNHTIEMLPDLKAQLQHISELLPLCGCLFITVPHASSCHLLQQWRFTLKALEHLARSYGFSIIDSNIRSEADLEGTQVYCVTMQRSNEYRPYFADSLISAEFERTLAACAQKDSDSKWARELNQMLNVCKAAGECRPVIYCYGSGNFAFRLLSTVPNLNDFEIVFLNSDPDSEGKYTVLPTGEAAAVHYYLNEVQDLFVNMIIIAVQDPAFKQQIVQALKEANCRAKAVFMV